MTSPFEAIAQRIVNAEENFAQTLVENYGLTKAEAFKAMATLRKARAIKVDPVMGRMIIKHGAYMDAAVIRRAVEF
jgi:N-acetylglucosamine-6-phosphate deacetylase